jgi:hypothetical protein
MSLAVRLNATDQDRASLGIGKGRYFVLDTLARGRRADVLIGVAEGASSLQQMVVIKRFHPDPAGADWMRLVAELELSTELDHDNIVRTLGINVESGRYFTVAEFIEGATLQACLDWAAATQTRLPNAVVARILLAILDAVRHADRVAKSGLTRSLVHEPIAADDVFISYDGQVKLLGFKSAHGRPAEGAFIAYATAIDALLEQHLTPELRSVLLRLPRQTSVRASDRGEGIRQAIHRWRGEELGSEGRVELARLMRNVLRRDRARQALRVVAAFSKLQGAQLKSTDVRELEDAAPRSGVRRIER